MHQSEVLGKAMRILIIGAGYVGLSMGVILAEKHDVLLLEMDPSKVESINKGQSPIFEDKIAELLQNAIQSGRLKAQSPEGPLGYRDVVMVCVGTPSREDGSVNLSYVDDAMKLLFERVDEFCDNYTAVGIKSTVPPGTTKTLVLDKIEKGHFTDRLGAFFNPEFLREGTAIEDAKNPDRIIIGASNEKAASLVQRMYMESLGNKADNILTMSLESGELCKYVSNSFLATKISFANEIANITERIPGADFDSVVKGMAADSRICGKFFGSGAGYGGSCFPKDVSGLIMLAKNDLNVATHILQAAQRVNAERPQRILDFLKEHVSDIKGKKIAVLGIAFKPGTDDIRESPALKVMKQLSDNGANVWAHDPLLSRMEISEDIKNQINLTESINECLKNSDACILMTEWKEYIDMGLEAITDTMSNKLLIDGRRAFVNRDIPSGITYRAIGRPN